MKILTLIFILFIVTSFAQTRLNHLYEEMPTDSISALSLKNHPSILPSFSNSEITDKTITGFIFNHKPSKNYFAVNAITDLSFSAVDRQYRTALGGQIESQFANKWFVRIAALNGKGKSSNQMYTPKSYILQSNGDSTFSYTDIRGRISFSPNSIFNFQAGIDNNFIGEGNRSLLLSDYSIAAPFAQIRTKFWRLEYLMLYQFYREKTNINDWKSKYSATHYLSINALKWLNFGFFETVMFQPNETSINRGFDPEYLNPMIFFRPQEYSLGSSDNILLGFQVSAKYKSHTVYGQIILDEFLLSELRAKSKWWGNKYGAQFGVKGRFSDTKYGNFFYRGEFNFARPYTYSHSAYFVNYGNQGFALAHPLSSNFAELLAEVKWQKKNWSIKLFANYFLKGYDKNDGYSYGGDIYLSYNKRPQEYKNKIGQGFGNNGIRFVSTIAYQIDKMSNLQVFLENNIHSNTHLKEPTYQLFIGIRSSLWNDYRNY